MTLMSVCLNVFHQAYGLPSAFFTLCVDDVHNCLVIRLASPLRTNDLRTFPTGEADLIDRLNSAAKKLDGESFDGPDTGAEVRINLSELGLHSLVRSNPCAAAEAFGIITRYVFKVLLGVDISSDFQRGRVTKPLSDQKPGMLMCLLFVVERARVASFCIASFCVCVHFCVCSCLSGQVRHFRHHSGLFCHSGDAAKVDSSFSCRRVEHGKSRADSKVHWHSQTRRGHFEGSRFDVFRSSAYFGSLSIPGSSDGPGNDSVVQGIFFLGVLFLLFGLDFLCVCM